MRIAVTGATGYIGQRLVRAAHASGHHVVALSRRPVNDPGIAWQRFDLGEDGPLALPPQTDVILHLAADTQSAHAAGEVEQRAAARLIQAAGAVGAFFVFVSSQTAAPDAPTGYGRTKWAIEQQVRAAGGLVVRPGQVYGGPERGLFGILCALVRRLPVLPAFLPEPLVQPVHVEDLVCALLQCSALREPAVISIAEPDGIGFSAFLQAIARGRTRRSPIAVPVPVVLVRLASRSLGPGLSGRVGLDRLESLFALRSMDTAGDLERWSLKLRPLSSGMSRSGKAHRELLREGRTLLRYILREDPGPSLMRRYTRAVEGLLDGEPLPLPGVVHRFPGLVGLLEGARAKGEHGQERLKSRLNMALMLAEATPMGARRFLRVGKSGSWIGNALRLCGAIAGDVIRRLLQVLLAPVLSRNSGERT